MSFREHKIKCSRCGEDLFVDHYLQHKCSLKGTIAQSIQSLLKRYAPSLVLKGGSHYKKKRIDPILYCWINDIGPIESKVIKYISRWKDKGGKSDLLKAKHCIEILIDLEYPEDHFYWEQKDDIEGRKSTHSKNKE